MLDTIIVGILVFSTLLYGFWQYYVGPCEPCELKKHEAHKKACEYAQKDNKSSSTKNKRETSFNHSKAKSSKRSNLKKRSEKANYSHNWLINSLKGDTDSAMDINLSSDENFATCVDGPSSIPSIDAESDITNELSTSAENSPKQKRSPRNRKVNHHFAKSRTVRNKNCKTNLPNMQNTQAVKTYEQQRYRALEPPLRQHIKLNLTEAQLVHYLRNYLVDDVLMRLLGFPIECDIAPNLAIIYKYPPYEFISQRKIATSAYFNGTPIFVNQNDGLLVKEVYETEINDSDSGQGSGSSSPSDDYEINPSQPVKPLPKQFVSMVSSQKECSRCGKGFFVTNDGSYVTTEPCLYHWGKTNQFYDGYQIRRVYSCCNRDCDSQFNNGCTANYRHVWTGIGPGLNGPYEGFVRTKRRPGPRPLDGNTGVYALDCEMCFTACGLELTKVTIVRSDGNLQYESFVRPEHDIVDYNTRFSGITEKDLNMGSNIRRASTASNSSSSSTGSNTGYVRTVKSLSEVQKDILKFIFEDTILIGHAIENDLKALKLIHKTVIDTSIVFPHFYGLPYKRSLKTLAKSILKRDIQTTETGHCSFEDSRACLEMMLWKVRKDFREVLEHH